MASSSTNDRASAATPVLRETSYDRVSSFMLAFVGCLILLVALVITVWYVQRPEPKSELVPLELLELPGGIEEGAVDETLLVESDEAISPEAAITQDTAEEQELRESLQMVMELSDQATDLLQQQYAEGAVTQGRPGSATGTGRRALGSGGGDSGIPREQRWFISFADGYLDEYARQLDFFGIELGTLLSGKLVYASGFTEPQPRIREVQSGADEQRLYMSWQGGNRRSADVQLLKRAGVDAGGAPVLHFYPPETEQLLARLERDFRGRSPDSIRRTYFRVVPDGDGYTFQVARQTTF